MGQLAKSLATWVRAMNRETETDYERQNRDADIKEAFDDVTKAALGPQKNWDAVDRAAWEILQAFDRADIERG